MNDKAQISRTIHIELPGDFQGTDADKILDKALKDGLVTSFDVGRQFLWYEGKPGKKLRFLKKKLLTLPYYEIDANGHSIIKITEK